MKHDLRYQKTETIIKDTFISLLKKTSFESLTVNELCQMAKISRNTFYSHYLDKYDFLDKYTLEYINHIIIEIEYLTKDDNYEASIKKTAVIITEYLTKNRELTELLTLNNPQFWNILTNELQSLIFKYAHLDSRLHIYASYSTGALVNCLNEYFKGHFNVDQNQFTHYLIDIALQCNSFMKF